ncbi:zinc ABC transporter permease AztB [Modestobacter versicolor]|uniref:ABC-type Mn2+/Zn2+ transport system permease subunit n=1 Tax=Modestobacter versicolor TaxID=429133 RepID=A0A323V6M9_9ACTN|nr:zinc ABC transporter permease AztB [Modestobacter versicolor]MBB3674854.1 ABC-type Mn2+/Zn2+ transport system permease subunit [Modestobacter versicolor]PZA20191.1 metal ABC transporter permease [Modestobacter versicolor]
MAWLIDPFTLPFMQRALLGGVLAAAMCAVVGTWVVVRGMAFLGEALAHGMLPGVAVATLAGWPPVLGAAVSAGVMSVGVGVVARRARLSADTSIGLLFVGMLALGVVIVSRSRSFATDVTAILFGDVLAIRTPDLLVVGTALVVLVGVCALFHRSFLALAFDRRTAATLGLRPRSTHVVMVLTVTAAVVTSYQSLGSLLVVALLLAPAAAARQWTRRVPSTMALGALLGALSVLAGLLLSWHAGTAGGASIAACAVGSVGLSVVARAVVRR